MSDIDPRATASRAAAIAMGADEQLSSTHSASAIEVRLESPSALMPGESTQPQENPMLDIRLRSNWERFEVIPACYRKAETAALLRFFRKQALQGAKKAQLLADPVFPGLLANLASHLNGRGEVALGHLVTQARVLWDGRANFRAYSAFIAASSDDLQSVSGFALGSWGDDPMRAQIEVAQERRLRQAVHVALRRWARDTLPGGETAAALLLLADDTGELLLETLQPAISS